MHLHSEKHIEGMGKNMATKNEVRAYLQSNFTTEEIDTDHFRFIFDLGDGRSQLCYAIVGEVKIEVHSPFADLKAISAIEAIEAADEKAFGIRKLGDAWWGFVNVVWTENVDPNEIHDSLHFVARAADEIESKLGLGDDL
jgi:hypothetical protein